MEEKKNLLWLWITLSIIFVVLVAGSAYIYGKEGNLKWNSIKAAFCKDEVKTITTTDNNVVVTENNASTIPNDWKTYINSTSNYSLRYPTDWNVAALSDKELRINPTSVENYFEYINVIDSNLTLDQYTNQLVSEGKNLTAQGRPGDVFGTKTQITIGGETAYKYSDCTKGVSAYKFDIYFVKKGNNIFKIEIVKKIGEGAVLDHSQFIPTAEKILSSFAFIDATANWKSYENKEYGFSFKYPNSWTIGSDTLATTNGRSVLTIKTENSDEDFSVFRDFEGGFQGLSDFYRSEITNGKIISSREDVDNNGNGAFTSPITSKSHTFTIVYNFKKTNRAQSLIKLEQTLSSFQFTN